MAGSECNSRREILDLYLDNELLVETSHALLQHLSCCPDCAGELERRIELRRLLKATSTFESESDAENILRKKIETALQKEQRRRLTAHVRWAVLAASLIVILGLGYWRYTRVPKPATSAPLQMQTSTPETLVVSMDRDAVANHQACALTYPADWAYDRQRIVRELTPRFAPLVDVVGRNHNSYQLIEGHICSYEQRRYAHLIFRGNGHTVSVFIEPHEPSGKPALSAPAEIAHTRYTAYEVSSVDTENNRIYLVSDLPSAENDALAKQLIPPTLKFVEQIERARS